MLNRSLGSLALKGLSQASKFLLVFYIARILTPEDMGLYGLMVVSVVLSIFLVGLDFYVFNIRQILAGRSEERPIYIRDQVAFQVVAYCCLLPTLLLVFAGGFLPWDLAVWFFALVVLDHIAQELYRLLTTLSRPVMANVVFFFHNGAWAWAVIGIATVWEGARDLTLVWACWIGGLLVSVAIGVFALRDLGWSVVRGRPVNWKWIRSGLGVAMPFFAATVFLKGMELADRFVLDAYHGKAAVGVYTFYGSIANAVRTAVDTGIVMVLFPGIIAAFQNGRFREYRSQIRRMGMFMLAGVIVLVSLAAGGIFIVVRLVDKPIYGMHLDAYWLLLLAVSLNITSLWPHYALFAHGRDRAILLATVAAFVVLVGVDLALVPSMGVVGAAIGAACGFGTLAAAKGGAVLLLCDTPRTDTPGE